MAVEDMVADSVDMFSLVLMNVLVSMVGPVNCINCEAKLLRNYVSRSCYRVPTSVH